MDIYSTETQTMNPVFQSLLAMLTLLFYGAKAINIVVPCWAKATCEIRKHVILFVLIWFLKQRQW